MPKSHNSDDRPERAGRRGSTRAAGPTCTTSGGAQIKLQCPTMALWRVSSPAQICPGSIRDIERALAKIYILREARWAAAQKGDVAAATAMLIDHLQEHGRLDTALGDVLMTAILLHAVRENRPARFVLVHALNHMANVHPASPSYGRLSAEWAKRRTQHRSRLKPRT